MLIMRTRNLKFDRFFLLQMGHFYVGSNVSSTKQHAIHGDLERPKDRGRNKHTNNKRHSHARETRTLILWVIIYSPQVTFSFKASEMESNDDLVYISPLFK
jgi:hypothetical protein